MQDMKPKKIIKPGKQISTAPSPMATSSSETENSPKIQKLEASPSAKFTQLRMNSPNAKILQKKFEEELQNSSHKISQGESSSPKNYTEKRLLPNFQFGSLILSTYNDPSKKFKPYTGVEIDSQQQCLLDNLWHIQTLPNATAFKVQTLNALSFYFSDLKKENLGSRKFSQRFTHYVIFRGTKLGVFHDFNTVRKFINCPNPSWKGYYSYKEALDNAREVLSLNFYIEPEEVKSFSQVASERPSEIISAQAELIRSLEKQVLDLQNQLFLSNSKIQEIGKAIDTKDQEVLQYKRKNFDLNTQNYSLKQKIQKLGIEEKSPFNLEKLRARILDLPYSEALKPIFENLPELDLIISTKALEGMIADLQNLQHECIEILFGESQDEGIKVIQNSTYHCDPEKFKEFSKGVPGLFKLQINLNKTKWDCDKILKYFHNGLIDFIEFHLSEEDSIIEILEKFGEKFLLVGGNMASRSLSRKIHCKVFSSLPQIRNGSYIPARKRIFFDERDNLRNYNVSTIDFEGTNDNIRPKIIQYYQEHTEFDNFFWSQYKLLAEGHYIQILGRENWKMLLPFSGEGGKLEDEDHTINTDEVFGHQDSNNDTDEEIPDTHRDF